MHSLTLILRDAISLYLVQGFFNETREWALVKRFSRVPDIWYPGYFVTRRLLKGLLGTSVRVRISVYRIRC